MQASLLPALSEVLDLLVDAVCVVDAQGRFLFVSASGERIFGYRPQELLGRRMIELVYEEDRARTLQAVQEIHAGTHKPGFENRYVRKDGRLVHIMWTARWSPEHQVRVAVGRDVTERKRAEALQAALYAISEATHAAQDLPTLYGRIHEIVARLLPAARFTVALLNPQHGALEFVYHRDERLPMPPGAASLAGADTLCAQVVRQGQPVHWTAPSPHGEAAPADVGPGSLQALGMPLVAQDRVIGALLVKSHAADVRYGREDLELLRFVSTQVGAAIARKQMETQLRHMARHDPLTDLPNRQLVHDRLHHALMLAQRESSPLAVLSVDLDDFKPVNDRHGHAAGDRVLQEVARRLLHSVRASDTVGRLGGDEFVVLLHTLQDAADARQVADKIATALSQPHDIDGQAVTVSASIGIALAPQHGRDAAELLHLADAAMYAAKREGGNRACLAP